MDVWGLAFWGLLGSLVYAGPRLVVGLSEGPPRPWVPWAEAVMSLVVGTVGAAAFTEVTAEVLHLTGASNLRAIAVAGGMAANPVAPAAVKLIEGGVLRFLHAPVAMPSDPKERK